MNIKVIWDNRKIRYGIIIAMIILLSIGAIAIYESNKITVDYILNDPVIEYGIDPTTIDWQKISTTNGNKITVSEFDTKKIGEAEVVFTVCLDHTCKDFNQKLEIKDTQNPEIKLKSETVEINEGDTFDPASNIESVKDVIDGDIQKSEDKEITQNGYIINSDVDINIAGVYTVTITAYDINGNKAESSYKVTVKETPSQESVPTNTQSNQPIGGNQSGNHGDANTVQDQPHYRTDISSTYAAQINAYRQQKGLPALPITSEAQAEADRRAMELVSHYGHAAGYDFSENIGYSTAGSNFFEAWKNSPNHNGSMLEESMYIAMAVSVVEYDGMWYAVTSFRCRDY